MKQSRNKAYFYLIIVTLIWGAASYVIKVTLQGIAPLPFLTYRFFISSLIALPMLFVYRKHLKNIAKNFFLVFIYGFITTTFALGILFLGLDKTTVIDSAIISAVDPLMIAVAGVLFLKERVTSKEKLGMAIAFTGILITVVEPVLSNGFNTFKFEGNLLILGYLAIMAIASVILKKLVRRDVDPLTLTNVAFLIGFFILLPFTLSQLSFNQLADKIVTLAFNFQLGVFYMAILSGTIAYTLWVKAQKSIEISEAGLFTYLIPIFSAPLGIALLNEKLTAAMIIGAAFVLFGVIIAERK